MYQSAVPVFADVCPKTYNLTAETIAAKISERTKAIMVTHLFGNPCNMGPIMELARAKGIPVIEDCAQAFLTTQHGKMIGTIGDIGCFSFQQGKHMCTGEGGIVVTNNEDYGRRMFLFINKAWGYGDANADHYFLAPNYRMNEITGAVALGQLGKLQACVNNRVATADSLTAKLQGMPGIETPTITEGGVHTYWKYCLWVDQSVYPEGTVKLAGYLREHGIASAPRYVVKPAFKCMVIRDQVTFGKSRWPFTEARPEAVDYSDEQYPGTFLGLASVLVLPWNERYTEEHVAYIAQCVRASVEKLQEEYAS
jgi:dTDP-4-amino-4,6-dideoxygalactose transaminase